MPGLFSFRAGGHMSVHITSAVWKQSKAAGNARLIMLSLADQANDDGLCWPSIDNIAKRVLLSQATVYRLLNELEFDLKEIRRESRSGRASRFYVLLGVEAETADPSQSATPDPSQIETPLKPRPLAPVRGTPRKLRDTPLTGETQKHQEPVKNRQREARPRKLSSSSARSSPTGGPPTPSYAWKHSGRVDF
jgi:hypothetical protein